jgi:hypothetical protein
MMGLQQQADYMERCQLRINHKVVPKACRLMDTLSDCTGVINASTFLPLGGQGKRARSCLDGPSDEHGLVAAGASSSSSAPLARPSTLDASQGSSFPDEGQALEDFECFADEPVADDSDATAPPEAGQAVESFDCLPEPAGTGNPFLQGASTQMRCRMCRSILCFGKCLDCGASSTSSEQQPLPGEGDEGMMNEPRLDPDAPIDDAQHASVPLSVAQYACARALLFAEALGHPCLAKLSQHAEAEFPGIIIDGKLLLDERQLQSIEMQLRKRPEADQVNVVTEYLSLHDLLADDDAVVPAGRDSDDDEPGEHDPVDGYTDSKLPFDVEQHTWPWHRSLADHSIRQCPPQQSTNTNCEHSDSTYLLQLLEKLDRAPDPRAEFLFARYLLPSRLNLNFIFQTLADNLADKLPVVTVGIVEGSVDATEVIAAFRFANYRRTRLQDFRFDACDPELYKVSTLNVALRDRQSRILEAFKTFGRTCAISFGNLALIPEPVEWTIEQVENLTKPLSAAALLRLKANIGLLPDSDRTEFQTTLLKVYPALVRLRESNAMQSTSVLVARGMQVALWSHFVGLDSQYCTRFCEQTGQTLQITLKDYFLNPEFHLTHSLVLAGANDTTGYGKTQLLLRFVSSVAATLSDQASAEGSTSRLIAPIVSQTLDLRDHSTALVCRSPILFDDIRLTDGVQVQYLSEDLAKVLLDVRAGGKFRCRGQDIQLQPDTVRVFSSNCSSLAEFVGGEGHRIESLTETVERRVWFSRVTARLITDEGVSYLTERSRIGHDGYRNAMSTHFDL